MSEQRGKGFRSAGRRHGHLVVGVNLDDGHLCHSTSGQGNLRLTREGRRHYGFAQKLKDKVEIGNFD
jgi:hypothetical protein